MCQTCNGTGGLYIEYSWGVHIAPCPDTNCDYTPDDSDVEYLRKLVEMSDSA